MYCAIIGSGNIGTDLMIKVLRLSKKIKMSVLVGIDPASDGLSGAKRLGVETVDSGVEGLIKHKLFDQIEIVFDATSAAAHKKNVELLKPFNKKIIDLTPAAIGPMVVPSVNIGEHLQEENLNMVTCGGQATIPIVYAISRKTKVHYAEIVASIASKSAGPGTRANIDEFTETTSFAIEKIGGAKKGKAIIILNPAEPPLIMRDTVYAFCEKANTEEIKKSIEDIVADVAKYVPGYQLIKPPVFQDVSVNIPSGISSDNSFNSNAFNGLKVTVFLEVRGAGHYLPEYAGNLDIMTSAALQVAEQIGEEMAEKN